LKIEKGNMFSSMKPRGAGGLSLIFCVD